MLLLQEKHTVYLQLANAGDDVFNIKTGLTIEDFILGPFDTECLGEQPPESNWSDWFSPPPRLTEWELDVLTDWAEVEAEKHDLNPDPETYPLKIAF